MFDAGFDVGHQLGKYRLEAKLGAGGMGVVYRAHDAATGRDVALKILRHELSENPEWRRRFSHEARAASRIDHPNIVKVHEVGCEQGFDFISMEYLEGETLDQKIGRRPLGVQEALGYAVAMVDALAVAHRAGVVHRDLKPTPKIGTLVSKVVVTSAFTLYYKTVLGALVRVLQGSVRFGLMPPLDHKNAVGQNQVLRSGLSLLYLCFDDQFQPRLDRREQCAGFPILQRALERRPQIYPPPPEHVHVIRGKIEPGNVSARGVSGVYEEVVADIDDRNAICIFGLHTEA